MKKKDPFGHLHFKTPEEWQRVFDENFDPIAYEEAIAPVKEAMAESKAGFGLFRRLQKLEYAKKCECPDIEYGDDCSIIRCDLELDRSRMATDADYVGVHLYIEWDEEKKCGEIKLAWLYSTAFSKEWLADELCRFNPKTFYILEWLY